MKKVIYALPLVGLMYMASCADAPDAHKSEAKDKVETTNKVEGDYKVDVAASKVEWVGTKATGSHSGTINITEGKLASDGTKLTGGSFVIDMKSIMPTDQDSTGNAKLEGHLKSPDFFDVEKFATAKFEITEVKDATDADKTKMADANVVISGNLTIKDVTKNISFPAKVNVAVSEITANTEFNINRTDFNVVYNSDESIKDKFINKEINFKINLKATK